MKRTRFLTLFLLFIVALTSATTSIEVKASTEDVVILSKSYYVDSGYSHIVGEVQNQGTNNLKYVRITATFYDSANNVLATDFTYTTIDVLKPQQKSPFDLSSYPSKNLAVDHYSVVVSSYSTTTEAPYRNLRIQGVTNSTSIGYYHVKGEVVNTGQTDTTYVKVVVTFYDSSGTVIGMDYTYTDPTDIKAGSKAPFDASSYPLKITPASYLVQVQCSESMLSSSISCSISSTSMNIGSSLTVSGAITPARSGMTVTLSYTMPNATVRTRTVTSASDGKYSDTYTPPVLGSWSVKASWEGDSTYAGATSSSMSFTVSKISSSISCSVSSSSPTIGDSVTVSGSITPARSGVTVTISYKTDALWSNLATVTSASDGSYTYTWTPTSAGSYQLKASWSGDGTYAEATSSAISVIVNKISSTISCSASSSSLNIGDSITVSGSISPSRSGVTITISYKSDGAWNTLATVTSSSDSSYSYSWKPIATASYQLKVSWAGDGTYNGATSDAVSVTVNKISSSISCKTSSSEITDGDTITITGSISPAVSGKTVTLTYTKPDGKTTVTRTVTTGSDGSYSDSYKPDTTGSWSVKAAWDGDAERTSATSQSASFNVKKKGCIIATATYGSELSPEVQFLREFRDNTVLTTFAGSNFMTTFNGFYYSFSPAVASTISENGLFKEVMKVVLYPLLGILHLSSITFSLFSFSPELGVVTAGLVASSLIAVVYVMPWFLLFSFLKKFRPSTKTIRLAGLVWVGSVVAIILAEIATSSLLMMTSTGAFVLATMGLTTLALTRTITRRHIR